jgi:hypothetical protein
MYISDLKLLPDKLYYVIGIVYYKKDQLPAGNIIIKLPLDYWLKIAAVSCKS